jgi:hypothetical protein
MPSASNLAHAGQIRREWLRVAVTALLTLLLQRIWQRVLARRKELLDALNWNARVDLENVQACLLTTVNLEKCGRIEKRTVMTKKLSEIFSNDYVRNMVLEAAEKTTAENPFVCSHLRMEDRWAVLSAAQNHVSSIFGPYHLFSNQVSSYESSWYVLTLIGVRSGAGRFFITPNHRLKSNDVGVLRIRIVLVNEQEIRRICSGDISETQDLFSERHRQRWGIMKHMAEMFEKQLSRVTARPVGLLDVRNQSWGNDLCGTFKRKHDPKVYEKLMEQAQDAEDASEESLETNNFLRIHVPVPLLKETKLLGPQDVVLYE